MKMRKENVLLNVLLGTGLYLLDSMRERLADNVEDFRGTAKDQFKDIKGRAKDTYETASERVSRAADVLRGEDHSGLSTAAAVLIGVGIGVGVGILLAPASGEEIRSNIADKVRSFSEDAQERASGTYGS
ncbi:MAG TPA: YtxH domain-containing protein [Terriglobales bacterium]|nr:YtxH domain-containing protein [Terriglobales bacterium]